MVRARVLEHTHWSILVLCIDYRGKSDGNGNAAHSVSRILALVHGTVAGCAHLDVPEHV